MSVILAFPAPSAGESDEIVLWHSYRGEEQKALEKAVRRIEASMPGTKIRLLSVPHEVYPDKIKNAIPRGHGPDLFIFAHELIGDWARSGIIAPVGKCGDAAFEKHFLPETTGPLCRGGKMYAWPMAFKSLALFYNTSLVSRPPETLGDLVDLARKHTEHASYRYGLVVQTDQFYPVFPFFTAFGGGIKGASGRYNLSTESNAEALGFVRDLVTKYGVVPEEITGALVTQLFAGGKAAFAISGPWLVGEIAGKVPFAVGLLPKEGRTGRRMKPFLTIEGIFLSARSTKKEKAAQIARLIAGDESARTRFSEGFQCVASRSIAPDARGAAGAGKILGGFYRQLPFTIPMPNDPEMRSVWVPMKFAIGKVLRGEREPRQALVEAQRLLLVYTAPPPEPSDPQVYLLLLGLALAAAVLLFIRKARRENLLPRMKKAAPFYAYLAPGMLATLVLVLLPFVVGASVSLFSHVEGTFTFVGLRNFVKILVSSDFGVFEPMNFYTTLMVTVLWTAANVALHVALGMGIALMLEKPWAMLRPLYRVLLIIPWAIPNYITALIWKGMFHKQLGTINALLGLLGVEPVSWFSRFTTAFGANLVTNTWLGFPFMMVVTLGALQAIPKDIEESARVDGAGGWTIFWKIKFPLLRPALLPAVILGTIWTFNMFNVIYLVSGGEPGGATDILISEAYRWAFERHEQYGYASAYAVLIFGILYLLGKVQNRILRTESNA
jgi:arabinogalactan oligomer/maltooligosaccharide transport system permease protein